MDDAHTVIFGYQRALYSCDAPQTLSRSEAIEVRDFVSNVNQISFPMVAGTNDVVPAFDPQQLASLRETICRDTILNVIAELQLDRRSATPDVGYVLIQGVLQNKSVYFWHELDGGVASVPLFDHDVTLSVVAAARGRYFHKLGVPIRRSEILSSKQHGECARTVQLDPI